MKTIQNKKARPQIGSQFTIHNSQFTIHNSQFEIAYESFFHETYRVVPSGNLHRGQLAEKVKFPVRATAGSLRNVSYVD